MKKLCRAVTHAIGAASVVFTAASFAVTSESTDTSVIKPSVIAPIEEALTVSQFDTADGLHTLLIIQDLGEEVVAIDLSAHLESPVSNLFDVIKTLGREQINALYQRQDELSQRYPKSSLDIRGVLSEKHVAVGANYADHAEESDIDSVFVYPKYAAPTGTDTPMAYDPAELLDYEVEICSVFDRDVNSLEDYKASVKGVFLCGDFTDRAALIRLMNVRDVESGVGFTDAKSGVSRFPVGSYLVIPEDWQAFVAQVDISLDVNGEARQRSTGALMILTLDEIVKRSLQESRDARWVYKGENIPLLDGHGFAKGQAILTGTPGGVVFQAPTTGFMVGGVASWLVTFQFVKTGLIDYLAERLIEKHMREGTHLHPGDVVDMRGTYLGEVQLSVAQRANEKALAGK